MQTVQFQCGHCNKLMAVGVEHLGQQVRCPHCQAGRGRPGRGPRRPPTPYPPRPTPAMFPAMPPA